MANVQDILQDFVARKNQQGGARYFYAELASDSFWEKQSNLSQSFTDVVTTSGAPKDEIFFPTDVEWSSKDSTPDYYANFAKEIKNMLSGHTINVYSSQKHGNKSFSTKESKKNEAVVVDDKFVVYESTYESWDLY
jgi:hypothetical protein